jgi:LysR family hydrogen peroxide-inducible transcriptional activator
MAARGDREDLPVYRSLVAPKPDRKIVALWPKQRVLNRAANEFLKIVSARFGKMRR